jgi:hypothetical protein
MLLGSGLWMRSQKMVEHVEKGQNMLLVVTRLAGADVIDNHVTDFFRAVLLIRSGTSRNCCLPRGDSWWPIRALPELRALEGIFLH